MRLSAADRRKILKEMQLADLLFNTKRWAARYGISARQVKRLRAEARAVLAAPKGPFRATITVFNHPSGELPAEPKRVA